MPICDQLNFKNQFIIPWEAAASHTNSVNPFLGFDSRKLPFLFVISLEVPSWNTTMFELLQKHQENSFRNT